MPKKIFISPSPDGLYDPESEEFIHAKPQTITIEHSLVSVHKWESRWKVPFLEKVEKTPAQVLDYIKCMTITQNVDPNLYYFLTDENVKDIMSYVSDPMTATTFRDDKRGNSGGPKERITAELIYYWMISYQIPMECQKWHLEQLMTLIKIFDIKNTPAKKMGKGEIYSRNRALNAANRARFHSKG